jgi:hypothetical protein
LMLLLSVESSGKFNAEIYLKALLARH